MPAPTRQSLCEAPWTAAPIGDVSHVPGGCRGAIRARVPGCIHTDLIAAGLIGDPAIGFNEKDQLWVGRTDWEYRCRFEADPAVRAHERTDLVCEGLDTVATIELNGIVIGAAENMFHPHRFDARPALRGDANDLVIRFKSPLRHIREEEARLGARPVNGDWDPYIFIRKAAYSFGWDWAPKIATSGIWKAIRLEGWSGVRIAGVRPLVDRVSEFWKVVVLTDLEWAPSGRRGSEHFSVAATLTSPQGAAEGHAIVEARGESSLPVVLDDIRDPELWWPAQRGAQPLYGVRVELIDRDESQDTLDTWHGRIGFRTVRLNREPDAHGHRFQIEINGKPIFCKGANWVPDGLFPTQMTHDRYRRRLEQAAAANMNMLRVWGGGFYESDDFYELCDEMGILVWQDFMFACAMYPEEPPYPALIEAEARHQITRLSSHPSVALWCGGNECVWAHDSWGNASGERPWKERLGGRTWGRGYYSDLLPRLMAQLDRSRPYWPNSPWSGSESAPVNDDRHGDRHTWDLRGDDYRKFVPRFCSEFGHQSPANHSTLLRAFGQSGLMLNSEALDHRQRATGGTAGHIDELIAQTFRAPRDFDDWHSLAQLTQARALRTGIEWLRVNQPRCMGALLWQLNDVWPCLSWSIIDSDGREKPAYAAARDSFAPRLLTIQPVDARLCLFAVNDTDDPWRDTATVRRVTMDGSTLAEAQSAFLVQARSSARIVDLDGALGAPGDPARELIIAHASRTHCRWLYVPDKDLAHPISDTLTP